MPVADRVEALLAYHSDSVVKLGSREVREVWRAWGEFYPLPRKRPHAILEDTVVYRLGAVNGSLKGKHALASYERIGSAEVYVLLVDSLVGWQSRCETMPPVDYVDANLLVTATDFAWTLGVSEVYRRGGLYGEAVFVEPSAF